MIRCQWRLWLPVFCCVSYLFHIQLQARPTDKDFISLDCGMPEGQPGYPDESQIFYSPDTEYITTGILGNVSTEFYKEEYGDQAKNLRYFPTGKRNCYSIAVNHNYKKFLVRAWFLYGNYDGLRSPPKFDLHIGVNLWRTVNTSNSTYWHSHEVMTLVEEGRNLSVCLVKNGSGVPFISALEVRPLDTKMYLPVDENRSLMLFRRLNVKGDANMSSNEQVRYPSDSYDRIWKSYTRGNWSLVSTKDDILQKDDNDYGVPNGVLQTAAYPSPGSSFALCWGVQQEPSHLFFAYVYIVEMRNRTASLNVKFEPKEDRTQNLKHNEVTVVTWPEPSYQTNILEVEFARLAESPESPILSAVEVFMTMNMTNRETEKLHVDAVNDVKYAWNVKKDDWSGDPCLPKEFLWSGVDCSYASANPKITALNLSSSQLKGEIPNSFGNLNSLELLDLSNNGMRGTIPDFLGNLPLKVLDISNNDFEGSIPQSLRKKEQEKSLKIRYGNNPRLCVAVDEKSCKSKSVKPTLIIVCCVAAVLVIGLLILFIYRRQEKGNQGQRLQYGFGMKASESSQYKMDVHHDSRKFTFAELLTITHGFSKVIGKGGFGFVYHGTLENGIEVAVKQLSHSSSQGPREFIKEAELLSRIHHRNLVSLVGYCDDGQHMALVYEYMSNGNLRDHLSGKSSQLSSWRERLRIATEVCQGLEYLHKGCKPSIIHRDVKTTNILLNHNMEAKLADFGLSKIFHIDSIVDQHSHVSTLVMGTPGYLDPEYSSTNQLTEKSDVYSLGIVLLELVTGLEAIIKQEYHVHIVQMVGSMLESDDIINVVDKNLQGDYDINSIWKAVEIAISCTRNESFSRPSITEMLTQLKDCLQLEDYGKISSTNVDSSSNTDLDMLYLKNSLIGYPMAR